MCTRWFRAREDATPERRIDAAIAQRHLSIYARRHAFRRSVRLRRLEVTPAHADSSKAWAPPCVGGDAVSPCPRMEASRMSQVWPRSKCVHLRCMCRQITPPRDSAATAVPPFSPTGRLALEVNDGKRSEICGVRMGTRAITRRPCRRGEHKPCLESQRSEIVYSWEERRKSNLWWIRAVVADSQR